MDEHRVDSPTYSYLSTGTGTSRDHVALKKVALLADAIP
jgi:hypothetical protein